jgi:hypothetical protein
MADSSVLHNFSHVLREAWRVTRSRQRVVLRLCAVVYFGITGAYAQIPDSSQEAPSPYSIITEQRETLAGGWEALPPYSYIQDSNGVRRWVGLDVELLREIPAIRPHRQAR